jgi:hypothetical protein
MVTIFQYIGTNAGYMSAPFTIHATKGITMTETDFMLLCVEHNIAPQCALEDENLVQALKDKDWERVRYIMLHEM